MRTRVPQRRIHSSSSARYAATATSTPTATSSPKKQRRSSDVHEFVEEDGGGTTDRNCRLLLEHRLHLTRIDELSATIEELSARIDAEMRPFAHQIELLVTIPGVKRAPPKSSSPRPAQP
jgi:hypothetical protein